MLSINAVCNEIIKRCISTNTNITPLKLQKLLYLVYAYSLKENHKNKVFDANFSAWQYGPVCIPVYEEFAGFGSGSITCYSKDAQGKSFFPSKEASQNAPFFKAFNTVWDKYGKKTGSQLVDITHGKKNTAWYRTKTNFTIKDEDILKDLDEGVY